MGKSLFIQEKMLRERLTMPNKIAFKGVIQMTYKEALDWCEQFTDNLVAYDGDTKRRTLGLQAMEVCKKAIMKQISKKPTITNDGFFNGQPIYDTWGCPNCGKVNETDFEDYEYCPICGQALDWGDTQ